MKNYKIDWFYCDMVVYLFVAIILLKLGEGVFRFIGMASVGFILGSKLRRKLMNLGWIKN